MDTEKVLSYIASRQAILVCSGAGSMGPDFVTKNGHEALARRTGYIDVFAPSGGDRVAALKWDDTRWTTDF